MNRDSVMRILLVIVLGMGIYAGWQWLRIKYGPEPPSPSEPITATDRDEASAPPVGADDGDTPGETGETPGEGEVGERPDGEGQATPEGIRVVGHPPADPETEGLVLGESTYRGDYAMAVELTRRGAGVRSIHLADYFASVAHRDLPPEQRKKFPLIQPGHGPLSFVLTRLDYRRKSELGGEAGSIQLDMSPSKPLADLNAGRGVRLGQLVLDDGSRSAVIDLTDATTLSDVIDRLNAVPLNVEAGVNLAGDGLVLRAAAGVRIRVTDSGGQVARDLGILQPSRLGEGESLHGRSLAPETWWALESHDSERAVFRLDIHDGDEPFLTVHKTFTVRPRPEAVAEAARGFGTGEHYAVDMDVAIEDHSGTLRSVAMTFRGPSGLLSEESRGGNDRATIGGFADLEKDSILKAIGDARKPQKQAFPRSLDWAGMVNKYFAAVLVADDIESNPDARFERTLAYPAYREGDEMLPGVVMTSYQIELADGRARGDWFVFAGPKDSHLLEQPIFRDHGLEKLMKWSRSCCPIPGIEAIAKGMVWAIDKISLAVVNKGLAVILLVIIVRLIMLPVTRYSQLNMMKMQELGPEVAKLKEKYGDDKQKVQMEQMKLFREKGINPMMGCLPMLLQMPIWISLYTGISVAITLRHAPFVLWIQDLAQPDALLTFPVTEIPVLSFIGNWGDWQLNVLPLLMIVTMFLQMRSQSGATGASSPEMERQQKMMKYMMPAMLFIFLYTAPSALNLYILVSSTFGIAERKYIKWHHAKIQERAPKDRTPKKKGRIARWMETKMDDVQRLQKQAKKSEPGLQKRKKKK